MTDFAAAFHGGGPRAALQSMHDSSYQVPSQR
jgi:hypothetical protein